MTRCKQFYDKIEKLKRDIPSVEEWCEKDYTTATRIIRHMEFCETHELPIGNISEGATRSLRTLEREEPELLEVVLEEVKELEKPTAEKVESVIQKAKIGEYISSSKDSDWETPQELFDTLDNEFHFTLDPCATPETAKCERFYTEEDDGLSKSWAGERCFMNPPYGQEIPRWVEKAYEESSHALIVGLLPARTDTGWFHDYIYDTEKNIQIRFLRGRVHFSREGKTGPAPMPNMIVVWGIYDHQIKPMIEVTSNDN